MELYPFLIDLLEISLWGIYIFCLMLFPVRHQFAGFETKYLARALLCPEADPQPVRGRKCSKETIMKFRISTEGQPFRAKLNTIEFS
jgi:hypothetical protein